ncbi:MAG: hypothetical protein ACOH5I_02180 [Oligoflexus sp.]
MKMVMFFLSLISLMSSALYGKGEPPTFEEKGSVIEIQEDEVVSFVVGETQVIRTAAGTYHVTLIELTDSRCPEDVVCVWQGVATAVFSVVSKMQTEESLLVITTLDEGPLVFADLEITLSEVTPYPNTQMPESEKVVRLVLHPTIIME